MPAPDVFADWLSTNIANDHKFGRKVYRYHPRSDEHSKTLCRLVLTDLLDACSLMRAHAVQMKIVAGINAPYTDQNGKPKTRDLAIGTPHPNAVLAPTKVSPICEAMIGRVLFSMEAKQCMTEHSKTKPRLFDELSSSHQIVHAGDPDAIAAGIVVVNIADRFASPTRQISADGPPLFITHKQPAVTESMVKHLQGLKIRDLKSGIGSGLGFDAFAILIIDCDNTGPCALYTNPPAPQIGQSHHYETFIKRITQAYEARFSGL